MDTLTKRQDCFLKRLLLTQSRQSNPLQRKQMETSNNTKVSEKHRSIISLKTTTTLPDPSKRAGGKQREVITAAKGIACLEKEITNTMGVFRWGWSSWSCRCCNDLHATLKAVFLMGILHLPHKKAPNSAFPPNPEVWCITRVKNHSKSLRDGLQSSCSLNLARDQYYLLPKWKCFTHWSKYSSLNAIWVIIIPQKDRYSCQKLFTEKTPVSQGSLK